MSVDNLCLYEDTLSINLEDTQSANMGIVKKSLSHFYYKLNYFLL